MNLWIRSQDKKTLSRVNRIDIDNDGKTILINGFVTIIGIYESKERALEVLDGIQNIILLKDMYLNDRYEIKTAWNRYTEEEIENLRKQISVYTMPEE